MEDDGFNIQHDPEALEKARKEKEEAKENQELQNAEWTWYALPISVESYIISFYLLTVKMIISISQFRVQI